MVGLKEHNGKYYVIRRSITINFFTNDEGIIDLEFVKEWRDYLPHVDHVLKTESHFLFVETIQEAEIIEETTKNEISNI